MVILLCHVQEALKEVQSTEGKVITSKQCAMVKHTLCGGWSHGTHTTQLPVAYFAAEHSIGICQISEANNWHLRAAACRNSVCCDLQPHHTSHCHRKVKLSMILKAWGIQGKLLDGHLFYWNMSQDVTHSDINANREHHVFCTFSVIVIVIYFDLVAILFFKDSKLAMIPDLKTIAFRSMDSHLISLL